MALDPELVAAGAINCVLRVVFDCLFAEAGSPELFQSMVSGLGTVIRGVSDLTRVPLAPASLSLGAGSGLLAEFCWSDAPLTILLRDNGAAVPAFGAVRVEILFTITRG